MPLAVHMKGTRNWIFIAFMACISSIQAQGVYGGMRAGWMLMRGPGSKPIIGRSLSFGGGWQSPSSVEKPFFAEASTWLSMNSYFAPYAYRTRLEIHQQLIGLQLLSGFRFTKRFTTSAGLHFQRLVGSSIQIQSGNAATWAQSVSVDAMRKDYKPERNQAGIIFQSRIEPIKTLRMYLEFTAIFTANGVLRKNFSYPESGKDKQVYFSEKGRPVALTLGAGYRF